MVKGKANPESEQEELGAEWKPRADETLGTYLKRIRLMRGHTLPDVARITAQLPPGQRVSHPYLSQIEHGQVFQPARERLASIAAVLAIPEVWVLEKAGYTSTGSEEAPRVERNPMIDMIAARAAELNPSNQKIILDVMETFIRNQSGGTRRGRR